MKQHKYVPGKCDLNGTGHKVNEAEIEWELKDSPNGPEFSASGGVWDKRKHDYETCGQCLDTIAQLFPGDAKVQRIVKVWREWHLNGMNAGTPEQTAAICAWEAEGNRYDYTAACEMLRARGLYEVPLTPDLRCTGDFPPEVLNGSRGYHYGERWVYRPIPQEVIDEIKSW